MKRLLFKRLFRKSGRHGERGQSMVEMALAFPILLLVLAGTLEVGKYFNDYLTVLDVVREGARYGADGDLILSLEPSAKDCPGNDNFYHQLACLMFDNINQNKAIVFDKARDDIVISAMAIDANGHIIARYPRRGSDPRPSFLPNNSDGLITSNQEGWSFCKHITQVYGGTCTPAASRFSNAAIEGMLAQSPGSPATGLVLVEMYHVHHQFLGLVPPGLPILPQEVIMHAYTMMPMPSSSPPPGWTP